MCDGNVPSYVLLSYRTVSVKANVETSQHVYESGAYTLALHTLITPTRVERVPCPLTRTVVEWSKHDSHAFTLSLLRVRLEPPLRVRLVRLM